MCRHLNLGDDGDVSVGRVLYKLADVVLCVVSAVSLGASLLGIETVTEPPVLPQLFAAPCGELCQAWVFLYLDAPACSVGEVQVQTVHLEVCKGVNLLLHELLAEKVTAHVEHHTTVCKLWLVGNHACRYRAVIVNKLQYCLQAVEESGTAG